MRPYSHGIGRDKPLANSKGLKEAPRERALERSATGEVLPDSVLEIGSEFSGYLRWAHCPPRKSLPPISS